MKEEINKIPAVALRGMTILPSMIVHFDISRERSVKAVEEAMQRDQRLFVVAQRSADTKEPAQEDLYRVGTIVTVKQVMKLPKNIFRHGPGRADLPGGCGGLSGGRYIRIFRGRRRNAGYEKPGGYGAYPEEYL